MDARPDMTPAGSNSPIDGAPLARLSDSSLATAGIVSTNVLESTQKITISDILLRGGPEPMTTHHNQVRVRIYSHITQSTFLHVEDATSIGKLRLFAGAGRRGRGITANAHHFLDKEDARFVLLRLCLSGV